eukprot:4092056-Pyramimonas_sp.AAC.1
MHTTVPMDFGFGTSKRCGSALLKNTAQICSPIAVFFCSQGLCDSQRFLAFQTLQLPLQLFDQCNMKWSKSDSTVRKYTGSIQLRSSR